MKKLMCAAIVAGLSGWAVGETTVVDGYTWTYSVRNGKATLEQVTPFPSGRFVVPATVEGIPVEAVGKKTLSSGNVTYQPICVSIGMGYADEIIVSEGIRELLPQCFQGCVSYGYQLPSTLRTIGSRAIVLPATVCQRLEIPEGVEAVYSDAFDGLPPGLELVISERFRGRLFFGGGNIPKIHFKGGPLADLSFLMNGGQSFTVEQKYFNAWATALNVAFVGNPTNPAQMPIDGWSKFAGIRGRTAAENAQVKIISSGFRKNNPMVYDVVYRVTSDKPKVRVRALGFVEQLQPDAAGRASYVVMGTCRPQNWIDGTAASIGDSIAANVDHKLSWYISEEERMNMGGAGMNMRLRVEVLACAGELLPVTETTIPGNLGLRRDIMSETESRVDVREYMAGVPEMKVTFDRFTREQVSRAAKFLYACGDETVLQWIDPNMLSDDATLMTAEEYVCARMGFVRADMMPPNLNLSWNDVNYWYQRGSENVRNVISSTAQTSYMVDSMAVRDRIFAAFGIGVNTGMMNPPPALFVQPKIKYVGVEIAQ